MLEYTSTLFSDLCFKTSLCQCSTSAAAAETRTFFFFFAQSWREYSWSISSIIWHISESQKRQSSSELSQLTPSIKWEEGTDFFFFSCILFVTHQLFSLAGRHTNQYFFHDDNIPTIFCGYYLFAPFKKKNLQFQHVFALSRVILLISLIFMFGLGFFKALQLQDLFWRTQFVYLLGKGGWWAEILWQWEPGTAC